MKLYVCPIYLFLFSTLSSNAADTLVVADNFSPKKYGQPAMIGAAPITKGFDKNVTWSSMGRTDNDFRLETTGEVMDAPYAISLEGSGGIRMTRPFSDSLLTDGKPLWFGFTLRIVQPATVSTIGVELSPDSTGVHQDALFIGQNNGQNVIKYQNKAVASQKGNNDKVHYFLTRLSPISDKKLQIETWIMSGDQSAAEELPNLNAEIPFFEPASINLLRFSANPDTQAAFGGIYLGSSREDVHSHLTGAASN